MYLLFIALIGIGIYFIFKDRKDINFPGKKTAGNILDERFVNGEIDEETYKRMKETLRG